MEKKMWWGTEEEESCGKALSCALEEEEGVVEGEAFVAKNIKCQGEAWKWPLKGLLLWKHLDASNMSETSDPAQEGFFCDGKFESSAFLKDTRVFEGNSFRGNGAGQSYARLILKVKPPSEE
ncbi:hypothetical protein HGM15179_004980 [Zosterops borbonicus]|uniref:Uncharacterized protein n=1 Tax=Zosterops borbonicus TaxID=364589 RepID=A0A8K1GQJ4_9PASS|nr:hypothetical protein HGM15179_004980 [Zosterops borbonicus]